MREEKKPSLYDFPVVYRALLAPEERDWREVRRWSVRHLEGELKSVMDPACGPATWLLPFAKRGFFVGGNDIAGCMIEEARRVLLGFDSELLVGDMSELCFEREYDFAVNMDCSVGHLRDDDAMLSHLRSVYEHLRPGGVYVLGLVVSDEEGVDDEVEFLYECGQLPVDGGGEASVRYRSVCKDSVRRRERIEISVKTEGVLGCPSSFVEHYELLMFPCEVLLGLVEASGFELESAYSMETPSHPEISLSSSCGDVSLILKRPLKR